MPSSHHPFRLILYLCQYYTTYNIDCQYSIGPIWGDNVPPDPGNHGQIHLAMGILYKNKARADQKTSTRALLFICSYGRIYLAMCSGGDGGIGSIPPYPHLCLPFAVHRPAQVLFGGHAGLGGAGHLFLVGGLHHRRRPVFRLRPPGPQGQGARPYFREARRRPHLDGRRRPRRLDGSSRFPDSGLF